MTVTQYLDLAYAVVVEDRVRRGMTLFEALDDTKAWAANGGRPTQEAAVGTNTTSRPQAVPEPEPTSGVGGPGQPVTAAERRNADAMAILTGVLSNTEGGGFR